MHLEAENDFMGDKETKETKETKEQKYRNSNLQGV